MQDVLNTTTAEMTEGIKTYKLSELEKKENLNYRTIKKRTTEYIPIEIENGQTRAKYKAWQQSKPYMIRYIRIKDINKFIKWL